MDEQLPDRTEIPPTDIDEDDVAPATDHKRGETWGSQRPVKGRYWFIRPKYRKQIKAAITRDKKKWNETRYELEREKQARQDALLRHSRLLDLFSQDNVNRENTFS